MSELCPLTLVISTGMVCSSGALTGQMDLHLSRNALLLLTTHFCIISQFLTKQVSGHKTQRYAMQ